MEKLGKAVLLELLAIWLPCMIFWFHTENSRGIRDYHLADELRIQVENRQMSVENFLIYMMSVDYSRIREEETLKALAVAARSRLYAHLNEYNSVGNNAEGTGNSTEST
ncbi:MAG: SpoIID/LytB domain-containing protein, partial [Lachnospiraceae bacterium]|nr:SpoIID/LytB domain-containing protein [Lachnospiraceae bacterium]